MASKSLLLLCIFLLVVATKVSSYDDEDLKIEVNYAKPPVTAPATPVKPPSTPVPPVVIVPTPPPVKPPTPPLAKAPPPPLVKAPPPIVKAPTPPPPPVKAPTTPPPPVKAPTPTPPPQPPVVKPPVAPTPPAAPIVKSKKDCIPLCGYRCKLHSRKGLCMRACVTCCDRCKCVPPGTYGNREKCGKCYTDMLTHGNRLKCP